MPDREDESQATGRQARRFMRVADRVRVELRPVDGPEAATLAAALEESATLSGDAGEEVLAHLGEGARPLAPALSAIFERLARLETKIDALADALRPEAGVARGDWIVAETLDLSGSGLAVSAPLSLETGDLLDLRLWLPGGGGRFAALGRVANVAGPDGREVPVGRWRIGIGFVGIHESDREALIRALFRRHRALLRDGRRQDEDD